jgi:hypothetical protein
MRRIEHLIKQARRQSENEVASASEGLSDEEFLQWANDAQDRIYGEILKKHRKMFANAYTFDASGSEAYSLPFDVYFRHRIVALEYSANGSDNGYTLLKPIGYQERNLFGTTGLPNVAHGYAPTQTGIIVAGAPTTGKFRLTYEPVLPRLDKRRGTVGSHTKSSTALTALTLSGATADDFTNDDYLTVVAFDGTVNMRGIPYTAVASNGVVSILGSSYTFPSGSNLTNGDWVCLGPYSSPVSQLPDQCERYLIAHMVWKALKRDSSVDAGEQTQELMSMMIEIVDSVAEVSGDVEDVPVVDLTYSWDP